MAYIAIDIGHGTNSKAIVIGHVVTSFISYFINAYLPGKYFGYGAVAQLKDIWPYMLGSLLTAITTLFVISFIESSLLQIIIGMFVAFTTYLLFCFWMKVDEMREIKDVVMKLLRK